MQRQLRVSISMRNRPSVDRYRHGLIVSLIVTVELLPPSCMETDGIKNVRFTGPELLYDYTTDNYVGAERSATGNDQPEVKSEHGTPVCLSPHLIHGTSDSKDHLRGMVPHFEYWRERLQRLLG